MTASMTKLPRAALTKLITTFPS